LGDLESKGLLLPTANLYIRWAAVQPMEERHPFDTGNPGLTVGDDAETPSEGEPVRGHGHIM
jgi:hypothetical protein